jgi:hypothetical protein
MAKDTDYKVDSKEEIRKISKAGEVETWYRIFATSKRGTYFHVDIRESDLGRADDYLTKKAQALDAI